MVEDVWSLWVLLRGHGADFCWCLFVPTLPHGTMRTLSLLPIPGNPRVRLLQAAGMLRLCCQALQGPWEGSFPQKVNHSCRNRKGKG